MRSTLPHSSEAVFGRGEIRQRVLVVGARGVHALEGPGKSTLLERYLSKHFLPSLPPTQGVASSTEQITLKGRIPTRTLRVEFLELTSDPTQLVALAPTYFNKADAVVFVYDSTDRTSFSRLEGLQALVAQHIKPAVHRVSGLLLATKANNNKHKERQAVLALEGLRLAHRLGIPFFDTSAETGINVEVAFNGVIRRTALRVALSYADTGLADAILQQLQDASVSPLLTSPPALAFDPPAEEGGGSVSWHDDGFSLLHYAARFDLSDVLQALLLRKGTEVDVVDSRGRTALHVAVLCGYVKCVRLLLKTKGVDAMKVDKAGRTVLALAEFKHNAELVTLLTKAQASFLYNEAMKIGAVAPHTCKLALFGSSGSGKTSLWRALRGLPLKDVNGRLLRTVLYEVSNTSLSALERMADPEEATREEGMLTPHSGEGRQQRGGASSSSTGGIGKKEEELDDDSEYDSSSGNDHTCSSFTVQLIQTLIGMKGRQDARKKSSAFEQHPLSSPHLYPQDDAGEVSITCWDIAAADAAVPLEPALLEHADVVLVCFDLVKATLNQPDTLRELTYLFSALDSQEHRPGAPPRAGIVSPARGRRGGQGGERVFHRRDVLLVGTFLDAVPSIIEGGEGRREGRRAPAVLEELNEAICQRLAHIESFGRLCLPHSPHKPQVFFTVGADDATAAATATAAAAAARNEVGSLRRALCKAVVRNGSLRKSRPSMWVRFLEEVRAAAGGEGGSEGGGGGGAGPVSLEQARQIANQVSFEFTNRPMAPAMFLLMVKLSGEMGEVLLLPRNDVLLTRRDAIFRAYQRLVERCREMELSPRRRSPGVGKAELQPLLQQLRATGRVGVDDLRLVLGEEVAGGSAHHLTLVLQALEAWDLCLRIQAPSSSSASSISSNTEGGVVVLFPGLPLALNDELFPFPVESPETYAELSGSKVLCYYSFREGRVPQGLLARLLFAGMRPQLHDVGGLRFAYHQWAPPSVLAKDHVEIALSGYTLSLTLDEARARVSCAVRCEEGRVLTRALEAQVGLILYNEMERLRKAFYPRFKMDLLVVDPLTMASSSSSSSSSGSDGGDGSTGGKIKANRVYDFVMEILQAHKAAKGRVAPDASPSYPRDFQFAAAPVKGEEEGKEEEEGGSAASYLSRVVHWATVMIAAPSSSFHPLPAALLEAKAEGPSSSSSASPRSPITTEGEEEETWTVHAPLGRLSVILPGPGQRSKPRVLVPHPGGSRRRCKTSAYVCLVDMSSTEAVTAAAAGCWCLEAVPGIDKEGFRLRWAVSSSSSSSSGASSSRSSSEGGGREMDGWYLGLSSQASEDRHGGTTYVVLNADAGRAAVWLCPSSSSSSVSLPSSAPNNSIGLQWSKDSYRYLIESAHDMRLPAVRFVILSEEVKQQQQQQQRRTWSFLSLDPSELGRATIAPLGAACIAEEEEEGREGGQSGGTVGALALRVQESEEDTEEGEGGDMNSPEVDETAAAPAAPAAPATTAVVTAKAALADAGREEGKGEEGEDGREDKEEEDEAEEKGTDGSPVVARRQAQALTDGAFSLLDDSSM